MRWDAQDKHRAHGAQKLPNKRHNKLVWLCTANLYAGANAVESSPSQDHVPQATLVQHPHDGHDEWDVGEQVDHGQPVQGHGVDVVEAHEDVPDDAILEPHERVAGRVGAEQEQHHPAPVVQASLHFGHQTHPVASLQVQWRAQGAAATVGFVEILPVALKGTH